MSDAVVVAAIAAGASIITAALSARTAILSARNGAVAREARDLAAEARHHVAENGHRSVTAPTVPDRIGTLQDIVVRIDGKVDRMHAESRAKWAEVDARFSLIESRRPRRWF